MSGQILLVLRIILAAALYIFLGWALLTLWQDLKHQSKSLVNRQPIPITLLRRINDGAKSYSFTTPEITIGRDPACDYPLDDKTVSAQHTRLYYRHSQWWVEDLRSTNGTFLNQEPVSTPLVLTAGDQLRCGEVVFTISIGESEGVKINRP